MDQVASAGVSADIDVVVVGAGPVGLPLLLLASPASAYMTGAAIAVDGGHLVSSL